MLRASAEWDRDEVPVAGLRLVRLTPAHAPALYRLLDDWEVVRMLAVVPWPVTLEAVVAHAADQGPDAEAETFVILADGHAVGVGSVKRPGSGDPPRTMPRLGYWVGRPYWNRGYATGAVAALTERAFRRFDSKRVGAGVFFDNPASMRVLEKAGFEPVGAYDTPCLSRGRPVRCIDMQITRTAWAARRGGT